MSARIHQCPRCGPVIQEDRDSICCPSCGDAPATASPAEQSARPRDTDKTERVRDREVIARIIDPGAWSGFETFCADGGVALYGSREAALANSFFVRSSLAKADAILSALAVGGISSVAESAGEGLRPFASEAQRKSEGGAS